MLSLPSCTWKDGCEPRRQAQYPPAKPALIGFHQFPEGFVMPGRVQAHDIPVKVSVNKSTTGDSSCKENRILLDLCPSVGVVGEGLVLPKKVGAQALGCPL